MRLSFFTALPRFVRWLSVLIGIGLFCVLLREGAGRAYPPLPSPLELRIVFPEGIKGQGEPIVVTGFTGAGDFLVVRYVDAQNAIFVYDSWGSGGPVSAPFALQSGTPRNLEIEMPTLAHVASQVSHEKRPLRVTLDGQDLLREPVYFRLRAPTDISIGENPIGGTSSISAFRGQIATSTGQPLRGGVSALFTRGEHWRWLVVHSLWRNLATALVGGLAGAIAVAGFGWLATRRPAARTFTARTVAPHRWFAIALAGCAVIFLTLITGGTFRLIEEESFGSFFDHQAIALLHGRFDVPDAAISGEAFIVRGKYYGYFGITPSLLRVPFAAAGIAVGKLSRVYMLAYYVATLAAAYALLCHFTQRLCGRDRWPSPWAVVLLLAATGLGSTLFFLGSRAYVYHEAILCGAAFALWSAWLSLRHLENPTRANATGALLCGWLAMHARPTAGLFALGVLGVTALVRLWAAVRGEGLRRASGPCALALLTIAGVLSFSGVSYLKFGTFDGSPFRYAVQYTPERRARFEDKNFHLSNLSHNLGTYGWQPDFKVTPHFPYVYFHSSPRSFPGAKIDLEEPTLALPYAMPALFALATLGAAWAALHVSALRRPLAVLVLGAAPMTLALLTAIVTSHRYTGDFCAGLIALAAGGLAVLDAETARVRRATLGLASVLAAVALVVTGALALHFQGDTTWGVPEPVRQHYRDMRQRVDAFFGVKPL